MMPMPGNVYLMQGPPGCGKTTWVVQKAAELARRYGPESVLVASLTKTAAREVRARESAIPSGQVGTLHSFAYRALGIRGVKVVDLEDPELEFELPSERTVAKFLALRAADVPRDRWPRKIRRFAAEWEAWKREEDAIEFEELGLMEKAEAGTAQLEKVEAALAEGAAREAGLIAEFKAKGGELQTRIGRMRDDREKLAKTLPADLRARYESLRDSKHGIAVGILKGELCTACRTQIPSHEAQALHAGPEVAECPNCKRLLVVGREAE